MIGKSSGRGEKLKMSVFIKSRGAYDCEVSPNPNLALRGWVSAIFYFFLFFLHPLVVYCARRMTRQLWKRTFMRGWHMWARWKEDLSASLRVKQCVRLWLMKARQTWLFVYVLPEMCQKSRLISDSVSACKAGSSCLDLSQHVTVTEAKMKDLMWKRSWLPTCVFSQLSSCVGPNLAFMHIACWRPTPIFFKRMVIYAQ